MRLEIVEERVGAAPVLRLLGVLDTATVDQLRARTVELIELNSGPVIALDLAQVTFVDSSGLGALLGGKKRALEAGIPFYLLECPAPLRHLLDLVGMDRVMDFCSRRELAERWPPAAPANPPRKVSQGR